TFAIHEDNVNLYMLGSGYMRYALLEAGARLVQRGLLTRAERVFFLRRGELESALLGDGTADLAARAEARRSDYQHQLQVDPPHTIEVPAPGPLVVPALVPHSRASRDQSSTLVRGLGASAGSYTGRARVVVGEEQLDEVQPGEVLVCPQTS